MLRRTVEHFTNVHIDHYLEIDFAGFWKMIDAVGGIDITVATDSYDSQSGVQWHAGVLHLAGATALKYVRQRYGLPRGDFDRIVHQHDVLKGLIVKGVQLGLLRPRSLNRFISLLSDSVSVDDALSARALRSLVRKLRGVSKHTHFLTVPVQGTGTIDGLSVVPLDAAKDYTRWTLVRTDRIMERYSPSAWLVTKQSAPAWARQECTGFASTSAISRALKPSVNAGVMPAASARSADSNTTTFERRMAFITLSGSRSACAYPLTVMSVNVEGSASLVAPVNESPNQKVGATTSEPGGPLDS